MKRAAEERKRGRKRLIYESEFFEGQINCTVALLYKLILT